MNSNDNGIIRKLRRQLSGPYRYFLLRVKALKVSFNEWKNNKTKGISIPVPPPLLRYRIQGKLYLDVYLEVGQMCANMIKGSLSSIGKDFHSFKNVLDFGCGNGRVMRHFYDHSSSSHLHGSDIDEENISWCRKHLPFAAWTTNNPMPPTPFAENSFDLIYAISVFTHLDERMQLAWLQELKRILKNDGILILTVHGKVFYSKLPQNKKELILEKGTLFHVRQTGRFKHDGLPDFYQEAYHAREYIENTWSQFFKIVKYNEARTNGAHDVVILEHL